MKRVGKVIVLGVVVTVVICTTAEVGDEELMSDLVNATYEQDTQTVRLNADSCSEPSAARHYILHELMHAWFAISGARHYLRTKMGMSVEQFDVIEEDLIRMLSPAVNSSFDGLDTVFAALPKACK